MRIHVMNQSINQSIHFIADKLHYINYIHTCVCSYVVCVTRLTQGVWPCGFHFPQKNTIRYCRACQLI